MIRFGIIGSNFVSDWMCESVDVSEGIVNHAVYSRTMEKGTEFAQKHHIPNVFADMEAFLSSDIDAVYIASPNFCHFGQAMDAMNHGKHVLVEKPGALNEAQWAEMCDCAAKNGVVLMEAMRPSHDPAITGAKAKLDGIAPVRRSVFEYCQYSSRYDKFKAGEILNAFNPSYGNAALMDIGVYALQCCVLFFGEPESVYAKSVKLHNGMEGMGSIFLDYGTHQAEVVYSKITQSCTPTVITGEGGSITIGKLSTGEDVKFCPRSREAEDITPEKPENNMVYEIADFLDCIGGTADPKRWQELTRITIRIMDEVRRQNGITFPGVELIGE
ncbi:MAG: Gfo/Idh/MocA family oxidoreductase [Clostridia bacterium]|nr:Gfo/Idh/MocA family oxidoreductase [Clostridia bacterium]